MKRCAVCGKECNVHQYDDDAVEYDVWLDGNTHANIYVHRNCQYKVVEEWIQARLGIKNQRASE